MPQITILHHLTQLKRTMWSFFDHKLQRLLGLVAAADEANLGLLFGVDADVERASSQCRL